MRFRTKIILGVAFVVVLVGAASSHLERLYVAPILMYHRVNATDYEGTNDVRPENFERQMAFLKRHGYEVISLDELVKQTAAGKTPAQKSVVITFDDGYLDNYRYAYPILKKYNFPATIFVSPSNIGQVDFLSYLDMQRMAGGGISFGCHTTNHVYLPDVKEDAKLVVEIAGCKSALEKRLGILVIQFCYPVGGFNGRIKQMVSDAGYIGACSTNRGYDKFNRDVFELKRIKITDKDVNPFYLWAKFSGYYTLFKKTKNPF